MKKMLVLLFALTLLVSIMAGCTGEETGTLPEETSTLPQGYENLSPWDVAIRTVSDAALADNFSINDLCAYAIDISQYTEEEIKVTYTLCFYGLRTRESYTITLDSDGAVKDVDSYQQGKYTPYLATIIQEAFDNAMRIVSKDVSTNTSYYFDIDDEGYLLLKSETIYEQEGGDGEIDHDHYFKEARVCPKPQ